MAETLTRPHRAAAFVWGYNNSGGLGLGHSARAYQPVQARLPGGTADVQGGGEFTVARTSHGELHAAGGNVFGQLGDGTTKTRLGWARVPLPEGTVVAGVQAGTDHVLAVTGRGEVYGWGRNHRGQVGCGSASEQLSPYRVIGGAVTAVACGDGVSAAITREGQLLTWGRNGANQVAVGATEDVATPAPGLLPDGVRAAAVDAGYHHLVVLTDGGEVLTFGADPRGRPLPAEVKLDRSWGQVRAVRAGNSFTLALTSRGLLLAWGANSAGQLGVGDQEDRAAPTVVRFPEDAATVTDFWAGDHSAVAVTSSHEVYTWGQTSFGQGGTGRTDRPQTSPVRVTALDGAHLTRVQGGANHVIVTAFDIQNGK
jgi:alpha-tubulin suppressor-like RCC1 family protein